MTKTTAYSLAKASRTPRFNVLHMPKTTFSSAFSSTSRTRLLSSSVKIRASKTPVQSRRTFKTAPTQVESVMAVESTALKLKDITLNSATLEIGNMKEEGSGEFEALRRHAIQEGAEDARVIRAIDIVVADWTRWKCRYGCPNYGKNLMCPPHSPTPDQTRSLLKDYEYALIIKHDSDKDYHSHLLSLERHTFLSGYHAALSMTAGGCRLCSECNRQEGLCVHPEQARPSMEACGIDVFGTARRAGFEMSVKTSRDQSYSRFCLLLLK